MTPKGKGKRNMTNGIRYKTETKATKCWWVESCFIDAQLFFLCNDAKLLFAFEM